MKKIAILFTIFVSIVVFTSINTFAASLSSLNITQNQTTIKPGEQVTLTVNFGTKLGSYTFDFAYDKSKLEYVSATGGEVNDNGTRVRVYYFDSTGGSNPRENMTITFKARTTISSATTDQIKVTAEGLANADASVQYDDITTATSKTVTIEPEVTTTNETKSNTSSANKSTPKKLPSTGVNLYSIGSALIVILTVSYIYVSKKK